MALELNDIHVAFGNVRAVAGVSLTLQPGTRMAIIGPNGSGKSTLINAISGTVRATGSIRIDGATLRSGSPQVAARHGISRTYQTPQTFANLTVIENVMLGLRTRRGRDDRARLGRRERRRTEQALEVLSLIHI